MTTDLVNIMSIDLEDWFCAYNISRVIPPREWAAQESRVELNTLRLLDLFRRHGIEATFFALGWVASRCPDLLKEIERQGHEIASHGYSHRLLTHMTPSEFEEDLGASLEALARCVTQRVRGFRAPSFSITARTPWAAEILPKHGIQYDSSVFPIGFHPDYGIGDAPLDPYPLAAGLLEIPMSCAVVGGRRIPSSGGGYFRLLPYAVSRTLMRRCRAQGRPVIFYLHPWEIDPHQPRIQLPATRRFRHYNSLHRTLPRLERLVQDFRFTSFRRAFAASLA